MKIQMDYPANSGWKRIIPHCMMAKCAIPPFSREGFWYRLLFGEEQDQAGGARPNVAVLEQTAVVMIDGVHE
jgi:hypothetical protein